MFIFSIMSYIFAYLLCFRTQQTVIEKCRENTLKFNFRRREKNQLVIKTNREDAMRRFLQIKMCKDRAFEMHETRVVVIIID